jgi:hypothetical protein
VFGQFYWWGKPDGVPGESHWQTLSYNVVSSTHQHERGSNSQILWWGTSIPQVGVNLTTIPSQEGQKFVETALIKTPQSYDVAQKLNCLKEKNKTNKNSKWCCTPNMFSKIYLHSSSPPLLTWLEGSFELLQSLCVHRLTVLSIASKLKLRTSNLQLVPWNF